MAKEQEMQVGKVVQVIGAVVDIAFDDDVTGFSHVPFSVHE